jgi:hypothetical protein
MRKIIAIAACPALLVACGPAVRSAPFKSVPARPPDHEIMLFSTKLPSCPYDEIGLVTAKPEYRWNSHEDVLEALKQRARKMGGDAVVGLSQQQTVNGGTVWGSTVNINSSDALTGTVIRFTEEGCKR